MIFDIVLENDINYKDVLAKHKKYMNGNYNMNIARRVFEGKEKRFYSMIQSYGLKINVVINDSISMREVEEYLRYLFGDKLLIIPNGKDKNLHFDKLNCLYM